MIAMPRFGEFTKQHLANVVSSGLWIYDVNLRIVSTSTIQKSTKTIWISFLNTQDLTCMVKAEEMLERSSKLVGVTGSGLLVVAFRESADMELVETLADWSDSFLPDEGLVCDWSALGASLVVNWSIAARRRVTSRLAGTRTSLVRGERFLGLARSRSFSGAAKKDGEIEGDCFAWETRGVTERAREDSFFEERCPILKTTTKKSSILSISN